MVTSYRPLTDEERIALGQVYIDIDIANNLDVISARRGQLDPGRVRRLRVEKVLVDTGTTHLCLTPSMIRQLGLPELREIFVSTAAGPASSMLYSDVSLTIMGRSTVVNCVELPGRSQPLLGTLPMEDMGLQPDIRTHRLVLLPESEADSHFLL